MVVVARLREAGQTHVAIAPPDWLGIRASMRVMFGEVVSVPELYDAAMVDVWVEALLASGARKIVLGGFARGYERLVRRLRARDPGVHVYATWHGNAAQHNEEYARWGFNTLHALAEEGAIACVGHTKVGLDRSLRHARYPIRTLLNWYPLAPAFAARPLNDGAVHLGLFTAGSGWRKNVHTQIAAAALIECHALHLRVTYPDELEWARIVNTRVVEVFERALPQEELHRRLQEMHCNFYVTYAENVPMFPFESLGHGVLAVIGTGGYVFRDHAYLRERLIVPHPDDPVVIAAHVERALAERDAVLRAYREFCREYIPQAERAVREFLAVE
jgi:glycosyltransferase involved in cell wall biosynthesis